MKLTEAIGIRLTALLKEMGWSYNKVETNGGVDRSTVRKIALGKQATIEVNTLYQILQTMEIPLQVFFDDPIFEQVTE